MNSPRPVATSVKRCVRSMREFPDEVLYDAGVPPAPPVPPVTRQRRAAAADDTGTPRRSGARAAAHRLRGRGSSRRGATAPVARRGHVERRLADGRGRARALDRRVRPQWLARARPPRCPPPSAPRSRRCRICDVHNGMRFPPERCRTDARRLAAGRALSGRPSVPRNRRPRGVARVRAQDSRRCARCSAASTSRAWRSSRLQEVFDARRRAGNPAAGWSVATTRELPGTPAIAQHVGVAWRRGVARARRRGGQRAGRQRRAGPAVAAGARVHRRRRRQAGARARRPPEGRLPQPRPRRAADDQRRDAAAGAAGRDRVRLRDAALPAAGARGVDRRARARATSRCWATSTARCCASRSPTRATYRTRLDGSAAQRSARPVHDGAQRRPLGRASAPRRTRAHVSRSSTTAIPPGAVAVARAVRRPGDAAARSARARRGDCSIPGAHGDLTHDGIDHVLISESLKRRLAPTR